MVVGKKLDQRVALTSSLPFIHAKGANLMQMQKKP